MGKTAPIAYDHAFPGCCGVTALSRINPTTKSKTLVKWIREENNQVGFGGLVTATSVKGDRSRATILRLSGFAPVFSNDSETLWVRRLRGG